MSAKGRGGSVSDPNDRYLTPLAVCRVGWRLLPLEWRMPTAPHLRLVDSILEGSAGEGRWLQTLAERNLRPLRVDANELQERDRQRLTMLVGSQGEVTIGRFEDVARPRVYSLQPGNPPFTLAAEHLQHAMYLSQSSGIVAYVLRLNFLGAEERYELLRKRWPPLAVYTFSPRVPFMGGTETDATEYAFYVWRRADLNRGRQVFTRHQHVHWKDPARLAEDIAQVQEMDWPRYGLVAA